ncbi:MAG: ISNCY family transposase [Sulfuricellaceae bacterium]
MQRTKLLQEIRKMRFEEAYEKWNSGRLTQSEAAQLLGVCERSFRRYLARYEADGLDGLIDRRLEAVSNRRAPVDEVMALTDGYRARHQGWNVRHFHAWYKRDGGKRSYSWVKKHLQEAGLVQAGRKKGEHRKKRDRKPLPGMMIHQDGSRHEWLAGQWWDLIVTMDDATNEHYSMFLVEEEGTASSFRGVGDVIRSRGLFCSFYSDRGSHYWTTPQADGKVDKANLTQFGRALKQLGVEMIPAYSPEARGRSERAFATHQERLPKELALAGITDRESANRYIAEVYLPAFNAEFAVPAKEEGTAFVPWIGGSLDDILCEQAVRTVGNDNCVKFEKLSLQIPADRHRCHYVKAKVRVHRYADGNLSVFHGPRKLADYTKEGTLVTAKVKQAA